MERIILEPLREVLREARKLVEQDWSVRDAVYACAPNGEADSAAILVLYDEGNLKRGLMDKAEVLKVFDRLTTD